VLADLPASSRAFLDATRGHLDTTGHAIRMWDVTDPLHPASQSVLNNSSDNNVTRLRFFDNNRVVVAEEEIPGQGVFDRNGRLWDVADPRNPTETESIFNSFAGLSFFVILSPQGSVAAVSGDDLFYILDLDVDRLALHLCSIVGNRITPEQWKRYAPNISFRSPCR